MNDGSGLSQGVSACAGSETSLTNQAVRDSPISGFALARRFGPRHLDQELAAENATSRLLRCEALAFQEIYVFTSNVIQPSS